MVFTENFMFHHAIAKWLWFFSSNPDSDFFIVIMIVTEKDECESLQDFHMSLLKMPSIFMLLFRINQTLVEKIPEVFAVFY